MTAKEVEKHDISKRQKPQEVEEIIWSDILTHFWCILHVPSL